MVRFYGFHYTSLRPGPSVAMNNIQDQMYVSVLKRYPSLRPRLVILVYFPLDLA